METDWVEKVRLNIREYNDGVKKMDFILKNRLVLLKEKDNFTKCFGERINQFWESNILGFDIIKFDKWLKVKDNESTADVVKKRYGEEGLRIIKALLLIN